MLFLPLGLTKERGREADPVDIFRRSRAGDLGNRRHHVPEGGNVVRHRAGLARSVPARDHGDANPALVEAPLQAAERPSAPA